MATLDINNFSRDTKRKASLTFSLVTTLIIISSLSFLININTMENVVATIASRNTTITAIPPTIEAQSPVDAKTGQEIVLPPEKLLETNPVTGQAEVIGDAIIKDPVIRGGSLTTTSEGDPIPLGPMFGIPVEMPDVLGSVSPTLNIGGSDNPGSMNTNSRSEPTSNSVNTNSRSEPTSNSVNTNSRSEPTSNSVNTNSRSEPTFNPMFSNCDTNQFEVAQYSISGNFNKDGSLQGKDFSLDIMADIINNDNSKFDSKDYPYKASFNTSNEEIPINIKKIITTCADITDLDVIENDEANHNINN